MLRSASEMIGYRLRAEDGEIGECQDLLFDDRLWTVRYMVADTAGWLTDRKVLISPIALAAPAWSEREFAVRHRRSEIENSPILESELPLNRDFERRSAAHYGQLPYWIGDRMWGLHAFPNQLYSLARAEAAAIETPASDQRTLRSLKEVTEYQVQASDGPVGHIADFLLDDKDWSTRYLVIKGDSRLRKNWALIPPRWVESANWRDRQLRVDLTRSSWQDAPGYQPSGPLSAATELELEAYFGPSP